MDSGPLSWVGTSEWQWEPSVQDCLCRVYFVGGRSSSVESAIDYVPTIFRDVKKRGNAWKSGPAKDHDHDGE